MIKELKVLAYTPQPLPPKVLEKFLELGDDQRGLPERAMLKVQFANGGGVLNPVVEHAGDLTHRMTHMLKFHNGGSAGYEYVKDKVDKVLHYLKSVMRGEHETNLKNNARELGVTLGQQRKKVNDALKKYAEEHKKLKVYNFVQWLARQTSIDIGERKWNEAEQTLKILERFLKDNETWEKAAREFTLDSNGNPVKFRP